MKLYIFEVIEDGYVDGSYTVLAQTEEEAVLLIEAEVVDSHKRYFGPNVRNDDDIFRRSPIEKVMEKAWKSTHFRKEACNKALSTNLFHANGYWYGLMHVFFLAQKNYYTARVVSRIFHDG